MPKLVEEDRSLDSEWAWPLDSKAAEWPSFVLDYWLSSLVSPWKKGLVAAMLKTRILECPSAEEDENEQAPDWREEEEQVRWRFSNPLKTFRSRCWAMGRKG